MKTILLVDDEYALLEILEEMLQDEGYRVVTATNGKDALAKLQDFTPDLIVTDLMMPIANGRDLIRWVRELETFASIPIVLMSSTTKSVALADELGPIEVSAFLKKPFDWAQLHATIVRLIGETDRGGTSS